MALLEIVLIILAFLALLIASYADIKTREIPDWLNYGLIFAALGIRAIFVVNLGWAVFLSGLLGLGAFFILGYAFYHSRQWGGGDSKLLMGLGTVIGISYPFAMESWNLLWFLTTMLLIGALYGLLWMIIIAINKMNIVLPYLKKKLQEYAKVQIGLGIMSIVFLALAFWYSFVWPLIFLPLGCFYLIMFVRTVEKTCFIKPIPIEKVTEGDWLAEEVSVHGKMVMEPKTLEKGDLHTLQTLKQEGKLKTVIIKEGLPFAPSFLMGYVVIVLKPDWIMTALGAML